MYTLDQYSEMGMLNRVGIVIAVPFAGVWFGSVGGIGVISTFVTAIPVGIYATGKYIYDGKSTILGKHFEFMLGSTVDIATAPIVSLIKMAKVSPSTD